MLSASMEAKTSAGAYIEDGVGLFWVLELRNQWPDQRLIVEDAKSGVRKHLDMGRVRACKLVKPAPTCPDTLEAA